MHIIKSTLSRALITAGLIINCSQFGAHNANAQNNLNTLEVKPINSSKELNSELDTINISLDEILKNQGAEAYATARAEAARKLIQKYPQYDPPYELLFRAARISPPAEANKIIQELSNHKIPDLLKEDILRLTKTINQHGKSINFKTKALDGQTVDMATLRGKVVLLQFGWGDVERDTTALQSTYQKFHDKGFEIITFASERDKQKLEAFIKDHKITWPYYYNPKGTAEMERTIGDMVWWPTYWLVDKDGNLADYNGDLDLERKVTQLLK